MYLQSLKNIWLLVKEDKNGRQEIETFYLMDYESLYSHEPH